MKPFLGSSCLAFVISSVLLQNAMVFGQDELERKPQGNQALFDECWEVAELLMILASGNAGTMEYTPEQKQQISGIAAEISVEGRKMGEAFEKGDFARSDDAMRDYLKFAKQKETTIREEILLPHQVAELDRALWEQTIKRVFTSSGMGLGRLQTGLELTPEQAVELEKLVKEQRTKSAELRKEFMEALAKLKTETEQGIMNTLDLYQLKKLEHLLGREIGDSIPSGGNGK